MCESERATAPVEALNGRTVPVPLKLILGQWITLYTQETEHRIAELPPSIRTRRHTLKNET